MFCDDTMSSSCAANTAASGRLLSTAEVERAYSISMKITASEHMRAILILAREVSSE